MSLYLGLVVGIEGRSDVQNNCVESLTLVFLASN